MIGNIEQQAPELSAPPDATLFKFPGGTTAIMLFSSILTFSLMIGLLYTVLSDPHRGSLELAALSVVIFGAGSFFSFRVSQRCRDTIAVNNQGIWYLSRNSPPTYIAWNDVATVDAKETQQRLVLTDRSGTRSIRLEYQLADFSKLRDFVLSHAVELAKLKQPASGIFHRSWINKSILLSGAALFLFLAYGAIQQPRDCLILIAIGICLLGAVTRDPTTLQITNSAVIIAYPGWKQSIGLHAITGVSLTDISDSKGNVWAAVVIDRTAGKPIKLFRFREGSIALCAALQSAWNAAGGTDRSAIYRGTEIPN
jgi:hypothetical protein